MEKVVLEIEAAAVEYRGYIYFCQPLTNGLFRLCLEDSRTEFLTFLDIEKANEPFRNAYRYENYAWFIPWEAEEILCVNLDDLHVEYYSIPFSKKNIRGLNAYPHAYFYTSGRINTEEVFLVPCGTDTPIIINMKTKEIISYKGIVDTESEVMWYGTCVEDEIWMAPYEGRRLIILNYKTGDVRSVLWEFERMQYGGMLYYDNKIWFAPNKADNMLVFDIKTKEYKKIDMGDCYHEEYTYSELRFFNNKIWIIPLKSNLILLYDPILKEWSSMEKDSEICWPYTTGLRSIEFENKLAFVTCRTGFVSIYDPKFCKFKNIPVKICKDDIHQRILSNAKEIERINRTYKAEDYCNADWYIGLDVFINICLHGIQTKREFIESGDIGKDIWNKMKFEENNCEKSS